MKFLHLNFLPRSANVALLVIRIWYGGALLCLHGWDKMVNFSSMADKFGDPIGLGKPASLALSSLAEFVCAGLIVLGVFTRVTAFVAAINMGVAFWIIHGHKLTGAGNGELPYLYLGAFVALMIAGAGKYSIDAKIGAGG